MSSSNWVTQPIHDGSGSAVNRRPQTAVTRRAEKHSAERTHYGVGEGATSSPDAHRRHRRGITLAVVTRNEERFIKSMLELHGPYVDEIVLVDTGSTDRTVPIADALGARTVSRPNASFEEARNESLSLATWSHILVLDPDEYIHPSDMRQLRALTFLQHSAYRIPINTYVGRGEWASLPTLRLVANDPRIRFRGSHHPELGHSIRRAGLSIGETHSTIHHFEMLAPDNSKTKRLRNIRNAADDADAGIDEPRTLTLRSLDHFSLGEWQTAETLCRRALKLRPDFERGHRFLGEMALLQRDHRAALQHFAEAIRCAAQDSGDRTSLEEQSLMGQARTYWGLGDLNRCEESVIKGLDIRESSHGWLNLAIIANARHSSSEFRRFAMQAATYNPFLTWDGIHALGHSYSMYQQSSVVLPDLNWWRPLKELEWSEGKAAAELYRREPMGV